MNKDFKTHLRIDELKHLNPKMPVGLIEDLVKVYDQIEDPAVLEEIAEELENYKPQPVEKCDNELHDYGEVFHFESAEEQDEFLRKQGKLEAITE